MPALIAPGRPEPPPGFDIDPGSPRFQGDPWPLYDWYREHRPVVRPERSDTFFVFGYDCVREVMTSRAFTAFHPFRTSRRAFGPSMLDHDGSAHTRLRAPAAAAFRPRAVADYAGRIVEPLVRHLFEEILPQHGADLIDEIARRLPMLVVCRIMGLPVGDATVLWDLMRPLVDYVDGGDTSLDEVVVRREELRTYLRGFLTGGPADSRDHPGLLHVLGEAEDLTEADAVNNSILLLAAGTETTAGALTNVLCRLAAEPEVYDALKRDRSQIAPVVAETLRHEPPLHLTLRFAAVDVRLAGTDIPAGSPVQVVLASANRDGSVYERPHVWDPARDRRTTLTFGMGPHVCPGMGLAHRELEIVVGALLDRVAELRLSGGVLRAAEGRTFRMVRDSAVTCRLADHDAGRGA